MDINMRANSGKVEVDNSGKSGMGWAIEGRKSGRKGKSLEGGEKGTRTVSTFAYSLTPIVF